MNVDDKSGTMSALTASTKTMKGTLNVKDNFVHVHVILSLLFPFDFHILFSFLFLESYFSFYFLKKRLSR